MTTEDATVRVTTISFDAEGRPRDDAGLADALLDRLRREDPPVTDVFLVSHGWLNNLAQARSAYRRWIPAGAEVFRLTGAEVQRRRPGFRPLLVGVHWPSVPFEDPAGLRSVEEEVAFYGEVLGAPADELDPLLRQAAADPEPDRLPPSAAERLRRLDELAGNRNDDVGAPPGDDRGDFDPGRVYAGFRRSPWRAAMAARPVSALLSPLWVTSFWRMKRRALTVGASGVHHLLKSLQRAADPAVRFHLIGHSFGAIVCAGAIQGPAGGAPAAPVHSLSMLQGALSLWSFARTIPDFPEPGYFHPVIGRALVDGPIVTTQSAGDLALRWFYKAGAAVGRSPVLRPQEQTLPRYGAVGVHGIAGLADRTVHLRAGRGALVHRFEPGHCYNVDSSEVIVREGLSLQGGHSNLVHAETAALIWSAALSG